MRLGRARTAGCIVIARITSGREADAQAAMEGWPKLGESPFGKVPGTHLARLGTLTPPARRGAGPPGRYLLLAADVDPPARRWIDALIAAVPDELDAVLRHCDGWPGAGEPRAARRWMQAGRVGIGFSVIGSPEATTADVTGALRLRQRLRSFVQETQGLGTDELRRAWEGWA